MSAAGTKRTKIGGADNVRFRVQNRRRPGVNAMSAFDPHLPLAGGGAAVCDRINEAALSPAPGKEDWTNGSVSRHPASVSAAIALANEIARIT